ncbi:MAG: hypothetical protein KIT72_02795 [Polyangiaceae bacterium]|nr:hypothetical protein [Polyangiaceae bacterium]MCW5789328.1 hypothetical protein [Polyangiaceae bacterium]
MEMATLRSFINSAPGLTDTDIDPRAREWLATIGFTVTSGPAEGEAVVLAVLGVDEDREARVFALPATLLDEQAHRDLAAVHGRFFQWFFGADLAPEHFAGAFRFLGGTSTEPDIFAELIEEMREEEVEGIDLDALLETAGSWNQYRLTSEATLSGPITHVYVANLCM